MLFDALGTLVELEPPWPLAARGARGRARQSRSRSRRRKAGDARRDDLLQGPPHGGDGSQPSLADLRRRCAAVLREQLPQAAALTADGRPRRGAAQRRSGSAPTRTPRRRSAGCACWASAVRGRLELGRLAATSAGRDRPRRARGRDRRVGRGRAPEARRRRIVEVGAAKATMSRRGRRCSWATRPRPTSPARTAAGVRAVLVDRAGHRRRIRKGSSASSPSRGSTSCCWRRPPADPPRRGS